MKARKTGETAMNSDQEERRAAPDPNFYFEVIDGRQVDLPRPSARAELIASQLLRHLRAFVDPHQMGVAIGHTLFALPTPVNRGRRPDVAFVARSRVPPGRSMPTGDTAWGIVPDLTVEVVTPSDYMDDLMARVLEYFRAGV